MRLLSFSLFCALFLIGGCKQLIMLRYGIKDPKIETRESIMKFSNKFNLDSNLVYIFKDTTSYFHYMRDSVFKKNAIGTLFFNRMGSMVDNSKRKNCQWSGCAFLNQFKKDSLYFTDSAFQLNELLQKIIPVKENESVGFSEENDLTVISIWAKFVGKYNERLFCISEIAANRKDLKVKIIYLNIDMLKEWNLKKSQMLQ